MNFNLDINKWVNNMLPTSCRKPIFKAFLKVISTPILAYYAISENFYLQKVNEILPYLLTDLLQAKLRTIYPNVGVYKCYVLSSYDTFYQGYFQFIGEHHGVEFDYLLSEAQPPLYELQAIEKIQTHDYRVIIPIDYASQISAINFFVNKYKPAGKRVTIIFDNII